MGPQRRSVLLAAFTACVAVVVVALPITWHSLHWGTVPEWIGGAALVSIALGVRSLVRSTERGRNASDHFR